MGGGDGRIETHRGFMRGSYLGTVGAFVGATVVPQRAIPQLAVHHPMLLSGAALSLMALAWALTAATRAADPTLPATSEATRSAGSTGSARSAP